MRVKIFSALLFSVQLRSIFAVELGTSLDNAGGHSEQITPIRSNIKRKKPINLNELPSTSDSSDEEDKRLKKKAKNDKFEPANKLSIKQIKELKGKERYQKVRAKRMNLPAEELKKFRLRQNIYNRKYRQDIQNKINSVNTSNPSDTQTKQFDLVGYRKRKNKNQKNYLQKMKKLTGFSDSRQAKLHEARRARQTGTLTQQQEQLLQNEYERKQRHYNKRKSAKNAAKSTVDQQ